MQYNIINIIWQNIHANHPFPSDCVRVLLLLVQGHSLIKRENGGCMFRIFSWEQERRAVLDGQFWPKCPLALGNVRDHAWLRELRCLNSDMAGNLESGHRWRQENELRSKRVGGPLPEWEPRKSGERERFRQKPCSRSEVQVVMVEGRGPEKWGLCTKGQRGDKEHKDPRLTLEDNFSG